MHPGPAAARTTVAPQDARAPWYATWFEREEYDLVYASRDDRDARAAVDLFQRATALPRGSRVLDVACGRGRHARELARRGYDVVGIDLSHRALEIARGRACGEGLSIQFAEGNMRDLRYQGGFDAVVNLFTSFGYFDDDADNWRAVASMTGALKPGGLLFQDFLNPSYVRDHLVRDDVRVAGAIEVRQHRWIADGRLNKRISLRTDGRVDTFEESVRLLDLPEFDGMYAASGLRLLRTFGDYQGDDVGPDGPRLILLARKPGSGDADDAGASRGDSHDGRMTTADDDGK